MKTLFTIKKVILYILVLFAISFTLFAPIISSNIAQAETQIKSYYLITQNTILIPTGQNINGQNLKGNIQINSTYYVEATGNPNVELDGILYRKVIYNGISGLVQSSALSKKSINNVSNPFFISSSKLTIQSNEEDLFMYFNITDSQSNCLRLTNNTKLDFIAYSADGKYVFVKTPDNNVGFVLKKHCSPLIIYTPNPNPINPDMEGTLPNLTPDGSSKNETETSKATITRVILIITLCVIVVLVIFLLFKPVGHKRKTSAKDDFYDF